MELLRWFIFNQIDPITFLKVLLVYSWFTILCFKCTAKWVYYTRVHYFSDPFPIQVITKHWGELPVPHSRYLLVMFYIQQFIYVYPSLLTCHSPYVTGAFMSISLYPFIYKHAWKTVWNNVHLILVGLFLSGGICSVWVFPSLFKNASLMCPNALCRYNNTRKHGWSFL